MAPRLSVVIPVLNESRFLAGTLDRLVDQSLDPSEYELLVVDGGSTDGTREIVRRFGSSQPRVRLFSNPAGRSSAGRNVGWRAAEGEFVIFVDGHVYLPGRDLLKDCLEAFQAGRAVLARPQPLDPPGLTPFQKAVALSRSSWLGHQGGSQIFNEADEEVDPSSSGAGYARSLLEELKGYDESFDACEDVEFNERVRARGLRALTSPRFTVRYYPREDLASLWRQVDRYGRGRARLWRKHPSTLGPTVPLPALFFLSEFALFLGALRWPALGAVAAGIGLIYAGCVAAASIQVRMSAREPISTPSLPLIFLVVHLGFAWGFVREMVSPGAQNS